MSSEIHTDILIAGAGPAGVGTSLFLAKAGIKHIIIDQATFPRDKICGDGLSGKVVGLLNEVDPGIVDRMAGLPDKFLPSWGVSFIAPNWKGIDLPFKKDMSDMAHAPGFTARRTDFDKFLVECLDSQYSTFLPATRLTALQRQTDGVQVTLSQDGKELVYKTKVIIGAGGTRCPVARHLGTQTVKPKHLFAGLRSYYRNVSGMHTQNFIELFFIREALPGYLWVFPLPDNQANVGIGILSSEVKKQNLNLRNILQEALVTNPQLKERFTAAELLSPPTGWRLPLGTEQRPLSGNRFLLTGDAGALIDPFTGEGIGNALLSGKFAAQTLARALEKDDFSAEFLKQYDRALYHNVWSELHISYRIQQLVRMPWLFNFVINRLHSNQALQKTFSAMFNDVDMRAKLRNPAFYLQMLRKR